MTTVQFSSDFLSNIRFSYNLTNILLWLEVIIFTIGTIWQWKEDKPKSERFWFITGVFFSSSAILLGRNIDILREGGAILVRNAHLIATLNQSLIFIAGIFYVRALTQHWVKNLWVWTLFGLLAFSVVVYILKAVI